MGSSESLSASPSPRPTDTPTPPPEPSSSPAYGYILPHNKLKRRLTQPNKTPLVLVACGSYSPITILHLQLFELAERFAQDTEFEIVGSYISPCSDTYGKSSLVPAQHRVNMCALAIEERGNNIMIDEWETLRRDEEGRLVYTNTVDVLRRLDEQVNDVLGGIQTVDGEKVKARIIFLMGADLAFTMGDPKIWAPADIEVLLGHYGAFIVERPQQCDTNKVLQSLEKYRDNIWVVAIFENDVSSTKARAQIQNGGGSMDLPTSVLAYIRKHHLYENQPAKVAKEATEPKNTKETNGVAVHG